MFMRKPKHKEFDYQPRYYDPSKDEDARRRRQFKFERHTRRGSNRPIIVLVLMFIIAYLLYTYFQ